MRLRQNNVNTSGRLLPWMVVGAFMVAMAVIGALPSTASAAYEQIPGGDFGKGELRRATGLAVNETGAGGVEPGSLYAVSRDIRRVARYSRTGVFKEAWGWGVINGANEFQRCGSEAGLPSCKKEGSLPPGEGAGQMPLPFSVAVEQSTGNVYVLDHERLHGVMQVFSAKGNLLSSFGELGGFHEGFTEGPSKLHNTLEDGLAVSDGGLAYVIDTVTGPSGFEERIMVFHNGVYEGREHDLAPFPGGQKFFLGSLAADAAGHIFVRTEKSVLEFSPAERFAPICEFTFPTGGVFGMTVDPVTGAPFVFTTKSGQEIHQLSACNPQGKFEEVSTIPVTPKTTEIRALAFNPGFTFENGRPSGVLYAADGAERGVTERGIGHIYAPAISQLPKIQGEAVSGVGISSAVLAGEVNPNGLGHYAFEYIPEQAFQANEPAEVQSVTVSATDGLFGIEFDGARAGGPVLADLTAGSTVATGVLSATATGTLNAASGHGDLHGAAGSGTSISGSTTITSLSVKQGAFEVGQTLSGKGIPTGTTITDVRTESGLSTQELELSAAATASAAHVEVSTGTDQVTGVTTSEGVFEVGQLIEGAGIPSGTEISAVGSGELTLSKPVEGPKSAAALNAGSKKVSAIVPGIGAFAPGDPIVGGGIPVGTTVIAVGAGELTLSKIPLKPGAAVALSAPGSGPLAVGEEVEGPGIPSGTRIQAVQGDEVVLSNAATASSSGALIHAGIPSDATAGELQLALTGLATIGLGGVHVSGGPGDESGSNPYRVVFAGRLENVDVAQLSATDLTLSGGPATVTVQTDHAGGGGFASGSTEAPAGGVDLPESSAFKPVSASLNGLQPDTKYRYRLVASNAEGTAVGETEAFVTYPAGLPALPEGRAYERVSPLNKHGGEPFPLNPALGSCGIECKPGAGSPPFPRRISPDGNALVYSGFSFDPGEGAAVFNEYLARRTPTGWENTNLSPALMSSNAQGYKAFTPALTKGLIYQFSPTLSSEAPAEYANLYLQPSSNPLALSPLLTSPPSREPGGIGGFQISYGGASTDLSRVFFAANAALADSTPPAIDGGVLKTNLFAYIDGSFRLVNVLPESETGSPGAVFGAKFTNPGTGETSDLSHAISSDGTRAFWSSESGQVYVWEDGAGSREIPDSSGRFLTASADGSHVLLTDGSLFDVNNLAQSPVELHERHGGFVGIAGQSDDLSTIYFVDSAVLNTVPNSQGAIARPNELNLYVWREGSGAATFVATLSKLDTGFESTSPWTASPSSRLAQASPDGTWLAFLSQADPLNRPNDVGLCRLVEGPPPVFQASACSEVYLYNALTGTLVCPSCNSAGEVPHGPSTLPRVPVEGATLEEPGQPAYLSNSGRLFFNSQDQLSSRDTNGSTEDVYEFVPSGLGECARPEGCVSLISAGRGPNDSNFLVVDSSGENVLFTTRDQLVPSDRDNLFDVYDARKGGGIPGESEAPPGECQGEGCQPASAPPGVQAPGSSTFSGSGNVRPKKPHHHKKKPKKQKKKVKKGKSRGHNGSRQAEGGAK